VLAPSPADDQRLPSAACRLSSAGVSTRFVASNEPNGIAPQLTVMPVPVLENPAVPPAGTSSVVLARVRAAPPKPSSASTLRQQADSACKHKTH
jgi:hypothetical protein